MGTSDFLNDFADMMPDSFTYEPFQSRDTYGTPAYGTAVDYTGRYIKKTRMVRDKEGHEVISTAHLWVFGNPDVDPQDRITFADGLSPQIISKELFKDEFGPTHTVVYFL